MEIPEEDRERRAKLKRTFDNYSYEPQQKKRSPFWPIFWAVLAALITYNILATIVDAIYTRILMDQMTQEINRAFQSIQPPRHPRQ